MWRTLTPAEEDAAWARVEELGGYAGFRPAGPLDLYAVPRDFAFYDEANTPALVELNLGLLGAFRRALPEQRALALDWQHPCYEVDLAQPFEAGAAPASLRGYLIGPTPAPPPVVFPVPYLAEGDYYLHLAPDLRLGTWGHPWRGEFLVFGAPLLDALAENPPALLRQWRVLERVR